MRIRFWGVRGSIPVPGQTTVRYGGNTPCLDILTSAGERIVIDAGTGIRLLGGELQEENGRNIKTHIFLSHTHWDHIQGLPFFSLLDGRRNHIDVYGARRIGKHLEEILAGQFFEPYLPFAYRSLKATMNVHEIEAGQQVVLPDGTRITVEDLNHPGGALGFRIEDTGTVFAYCCDTGHDVNDFNPGVLALARGADLLVHDAHFPNHDVASEFADWGHSSYFEAGSLARAAGAKVLALFHYSPEMSDDLLDELHEPALAHFPQTIFTYEGLELRLPWDKIPPIDLYQPGTTAARVMRTDSWKE